MRFPSSYYGGISPSQLFGRGDVCTEAFPNGGAYSKTCTPGNTTCCYRKGQNFPRCVDGGGKGWCCEGTGSSNCFVDQASACDEPNAVVCTNLARGAKKACCPSKSKCDDDFKASELDVRCRMEFDNLVKLAAGKVGLELPSTESVTVSATGGSMTANDQTSRSPMASSSGGETGMTSGASSSTPTPSSASLTSGLPTGVVALPSASASTSASASSLPSSTPSDTNATGVTSFWRSKSAIASVTLCILLFSAFIALLVFGLRRQRKKAAAIRAMTQLPRGAYIPERPGYLPLETEQNAAEMSSTPAQDRQRQREVEQRDGEMRPPSYYAACPKGQPPGRDGEQEDEDELAELDDTQVKSVLNGEGP